MNIPFLIEMAQRKLDLVQNARIGAVASGNLSEVVRLDAEIVETKATLDKLKTLG